MDLANTDVPSSRLRIAAFAPIGEEGRTALVEARLVQAISVGAFLEGERLPSETELSELLGVSVVTVREALGVLRYSGLIETRRGRNGGSFVRSSYGAVEEINARALSQISRVELVDLGLHYELIATACAELACQRATNHELDMVEEMMAHAHKVSREEWRRKITEVELELAALSQSVRLTNEHVRLQTELTPFFALRDQEEAARVVTHNSLLARIAAMRIGDVELVRENVRECIRSSMHWLFTFRCTLFASEQTSET